jgi:hypothetical protein
MALDCKSYELTRKRYKGLQGCLKDGSIQQAYRGIVSYLSRLRSVFADKFIEQAVSGLYQGHFDMTYFALFPDALKASDLKLAIVFNFQTIVLQPLKML